MPHTVKLQFIVHIKKAYLKPTCFLPPPLMQMAAVCVLILGPVLSRREPFHLPHMSLLAQATVGVFVAGLLGLTVVGAVRGQLAEVHWLPTPKALHSTSTHFAIKMLATLPTISMSLASHYNLLPVVSYGCVVQRANKTCPYSLVVLR